MLQAQESNNALALNAESYLGILGKKTCERDLSKLQCKQEKKGGMIS